MTIAVNKYRFTFMLAMGLAVLGWAWPAAAQHSDMTDEQREALAKQGDGNESLVPPRPAKLPDLTKGDPTGEREKAHEWNLGPTGLVGYMPGGLKGDQIEVTSVLKGSPAVGKLQWGDVILGVGGQKFVAGQNMGVPFGNAIIEAEREVNGGVLKLQVWRDRNFIKRNGRKDIAGADIDQMIEDASTDLSLYDWKSEDEKEKEVRSSNFDEFPIDTVIMEVTLELETFPDYSETSPYDCPKTQKILEHAWAVLEKKFQPDERGRGGHGGSLEALALVASGKPEHRKLVADWVRSPRNRTWVPLRDTGSSVKLPTKCWDMSFRGIECALYLEATGDEYVRPLVEQYALVSARGQSGGGSWGHNWAQPSFNGGYYNRMNPGYGAVNTTGNRLFFLLVLARQMGIEHPDIDRAIERSRRFFSSYVDKGCIPYGHHGAWPSDDSNGKNAGVAHALKLLGDDYGALYFARMSTHASFTRRGGHGHDWFWHWSPWAAQLCGPKGVIVTHRNMRWWHTLCRRHDGSFIIHSPTGSRQLRDSTATYVLHYSAPFKQTLITGKNIKPSYEWTDEELQRLLTIAQGQFSDPSLKERAGKRITQRSTDEVFAYLNIFMPKTRGHIARELGKRYQAGEKDILPRLGELLTSDDPRFRGGACEALAACGTDATLQYMSAVAKLLEDEHDFVRMMAAKTMSSASDSHDTQIALLKATAHQDMSKTMSPNSLPTLTQKILFGGDSALAKSPFDAGFDETVVREALEKLITLDPTGNRPMIASRSKVWSKDTVVQLAGPLIFAAEQEQIADQMFSSRRPATIAMLEKLGYREAVDAGASYLRRFNNLPRDIRPRVTYKRGIVDGKTMLRHRGQSREYLDALKLWLLDKPLDMAFAGNKEEPGIPLYVLVHALEATKATGSMPSLVDDVDRFFRARLAGLESDQARLAMCRDELADVDRYNYIRKLIALRFLSEQLGDQALADIVPYLGHDHWRLREAAHALATKHGAGQESMLVDALAKAEDEQASAILAVLGELKTRPALAAIEKALTHQSPAIRGAAIEALFVAQGDKALDRVLEQIKSATASMELRGCEKALLSKRDDAAFAKRLGGKPLAMLPEKDSARRESLYYLIGQIGGAQGVAVLQRAGVETEDMDEFRAAVNALSYCPELAADQALVQIIRASLKKRGRAEVAASMGIRRMVVGPNGIGNRTIKEQLDYAQGVLDLVLDGVTITYLGRIHTGRCAYILQRAMRRGATDVAAQAIIVATADLSDAPEADRKLAVAALIDTIEFIEVTYLRGGATEQNWKTYPMWKAISAQAGKNLLKLNKTEKVPLPEFDDNDLDL